MSASMLKPALRRISTARSSALGPIAASSMSAAETASRRSSPSADRNVSSNAAVRVRSARTGGCSGILGKYQRFAAGFDLFTQLHDREDHGIGAWRAAGHVDVNREDSVDT